MRQELEDGTIVEKGDDGSFTVTAWGYPQVKDKDNQRLPVDEIIKDTPMMMAHEPKIHLHHTDTEVGKILDVWKADKTLKDGSKVPSPRVKYSLYGDRRFHKAVRRRVESNDLGMVSIKGYAYGKPTYEKDGNGMVEVPHDLEVVTYALCGEGARNPEAYNDSVVVDGKELKKSNDLELLGNDDFLKEVQTHMKDGLSYKQAMSMVKETYSDEMHKALIDEWDELEPQTLEKMIKHEGNNYVVYDSSKNIQKDDTMPDELETIKKELENLKVANEATVKENEAIVKERDGLKDELEKANKPEDPPADPPKKEVKKDIEPETLTKESVLELIKADRAEFRKELFADPAAIMKELGFEKHEGTAQDMSSSFKEFTKSLQAGDGKEVDQDGLQMFATTMDMAKSAQMNSDIDDIPTQEQLMKAAQEESYGMTGGV